MLKLHLSAWVKKLLEILELKKDFTEKNTLLEVANSGFKIMSEILVKEINFSQETQIVRFLCFTLFIVEFINIYLDYKCNNTFIYWI